MGWVYENKGPPINAAQTVASEGRGSGFRTERVSGDYESLGGFREPRGASVSEALQAPQPKSRKAGRLRLSDTLPGRAGHQAMPCVFPLLYG